MIAPQKYKNALQAFRGVIVHARTLAYRSAPYKTIAGILDAAEYLRFLIAKPSDETDRFRSNLEGIANKYNPCRAQAHVGCANLPALRD